MQLPSCLFIQYYGCIYSLLSSGKEEGRMFFVQIDECLCVEMIMNKHVIFYSFLK